MIWKTILIIIFESIKSSTIRLLSNQPWIFSQTNLTYKVSHSLVWESLLKNLYQII